MKKIFNSSIFFALVGVLSGRVFYVPLDYNNPNEALLHLKSGDTLVYRPGWIEEKLNKSLLQEKGITLIYANRGYQLGENLKEPLNGGWGWTGPKRLTSENSIFAMECRLAVDSSNVPWAVWVGITTENPNGHDVCYSRYKGGGWEWLERVNTDTTSICFQPRISMDPQSIPWVVWHIFVNNYQRDIYYTRWNGEGWDPEELLNPPDTLFDGPAFIGHGGGKTWASWESGEYEYGDIWASLWEGDGWGEPVRISYNDGIEDGYPSSMVVDQNGRAHFVWTHRGPEGTIPYYRSYDGDSMSPLISLIRPNGGIGGDWPELCVDTLGNVHVVWTGVTEEPPENSYVFYRMLSADGEWTDPVYVNRLDGLGNWRVVVSAKSPTDVWVVWDGVDSSYEYHIYAVHYDGESWTDEMQLDNDKTIDDGGPDVEMDLGSHPWVVWGGLGINEEHYQIYYDVYMPLGIGEGFVGTKVGGGIRVYPNPFCRWLELRMVGVGNLEGRIHIYDIQGREVREVGIEEDGRVLLDLGNLVGGVYFLRYGGDVYPLIKVRR